jgi:hypothetical protein
MVAEPLPDGSLSTVIHEAFDPAVHAHPLPAVSATVNVPPAAAAAYESGDSVKLHVTGAAA